MKISVCAGDDVLPDFYISKPGYGDGIAEITAYDNCRALELFFDTSDVFSEEKDYEVPLVLQKIASDCGFSGYSPGKLNISVIPYKYLKGKTCRSILELLSETGCGVWFCNSDNMLEFRNFGIVTDYCTLNDSNCSDFRRGAVRGPVSAIRVNNPVEGSDYQLGYSSDFTNIIKVKGKLIDENVARSILSTVSGAEYRAFSCKKALTEHIPDALCGFVFGGVCYSATSIVTYITPFGFYSCIKSPSISEDRFDYVGSVEYSLAERILEEKKYGTTKISYSGLKFANDSGEYEYGFGVKKGGFTSYEGVQSSTKEAAQIDVDKNAGTVTVTYKDKSVYKYSAAVSESDSSFTITDEKDEWTEPPEK